MVAKIISIRTPVMSNLFYCAYYGNISYLILDDELY